jgi:hypothetical protein
VLRFVRVMAVALTASGICSRLHSQTPAASVSLGFGVDTAIVDVGHIVSLTRAYLAQPDSSARSRGLWSTADEFDRRYGDITAADVYQGFRATIVGIVPVSPEDSVYVVKILHATADSSGQSISPLALQRLFAVRESGAPFAFRLSAALPRLTKSWERRSKGALTFHYAPGVQPNLGKINQSARFVDSVATLFHVPPPSHLDVYVAQTIDEAQRATGLDFAIEASGPGNGVGGRTLASGIILSGDPRVGEAYFHEFVHAVLGPTLRPGTALLGEGIPTWLGGSQGKSPRDMYALLKREQDADPRLTLTDVLDYDFQNKPAKLGSDLQRATGALFANAVYRERGIACLRKLAQLRGDTNSLMRELAAQLELGDPHSESLDSWWRADAKRMAGVPGKSGR